VFLPANPSFIELPEARAEDLTPRSGWANKLDVAERKYVEEKQHKEELQEKIEQLRLHISTIESTASLNLEQLSAHIVSLEREIESMQKKEEDLKAQIKNRDDYIATVKNIIEENEHKYHKHLEKIRREYERLEDNNKMLKERIAELTEESQSLRLQSLEHRNETAKTQGIRDTEKTLLQNQLKETQSEVFRLNNKCSDLTRELDRTKFLYDESSSKISKVERELIYKENEIKRLEELVKLAEDKLRADDRHVERTTHERVLMATQQHKDERHDTETKYKLEQKTTFELRTQLEQLNRTVAALRAENLELKAVNKINEENLIKAEMLEQEMTKQFNTLKVKYDSHFSRVDHEGFNKELRVVQLKEEVASLRTEKEFHERLIFQYQNFLKMYNLDYEFNSLTRLEHGNLSKPITDLKLEAREKAARDFYVQNEGKKYAEKAKEKYKMYEEGTQQKVDKFRKEMDNIGDEMEEEWKKLFTSLTEFKAKINV